MIELPKVNTSKTVLDETNNIDLVGNRSSNADETAFSFRGKALKFFLGAACLVSVFYLASASQNSSSVNTSNEGISSYEDHVDWNTFEPLKFHQSGFGALNIHHHVDGLSKVRRKLETSNAVIPKSAVEHAIPSLGEPNIINLHGHYVHDEHRSPYSSLSYDRPKEELRQEQAEYVAKMQKIREEWGMWSFKDHSSSVRPVQKFEKFEYKDVGPRQWTKGAWQTDREYTEAFIKEGKQLVERMTEAIYAEVGLPTKKSDGSKLSKEEIDIRDAKFKVHIIDDDKDGAKETFDDGVAYLSNSAFDALVRKLLHGMMTNDEFYFVLGGHSAAAGHGNNIHQQKTMVSRKMSNQCLSPVTYWYSYKIWFQFLLC